MDKHRQANLSAKPALCARAYDAIRGELLSFLAPVDVGLKYLFAIFRVPKTNDILRFGDYRTAPLVLAAWDRFETDGTFAMLGL
jgi:hypothetical protein